LGFVNCGPIFQEDKAGCEDELLRDTQGQGNGTPRQQEATFYCAGTDSGDSYPKAENKGALPYIPFQAGYRSKKQGLIHIWLHAALLATSPPCAKCDLQV
jgi:hypothetical protein